MNIVVQEQTQGSLEGILRKLSHSISLLPNLHTVQMHFKFTDYYHSTLDGNSYHSELVRDCFKGYTCPQIQNLSISPTALPFIYVCPKLKVLKPYQAKYLGVTRDMLDQVPELEVLGCICMNGETLKGIGVSMNFVCLHCSQV